MKNIIYLLRLEVNGIKNIEKPIELRFYKKTIENDFDPENYRIKAIYGENGSGKTAIILAVRILQNILLDSNYLFGTEMQKNLVESVNKFTKKGFIECEFIYENTDEYCICKYHLDFAINNDHRFYIVGETFEAKKGNYTKNKYTTVFQTQYGELKKIGNGKNMEYYKRITQNLLEQRSFLSFVFKEKDFNIDIIIKDNSFIFLLALLVFAASINVYLDEEDNHLNYFIKKRIDELDDKDTTNEQIEIIREANKQILNSYFDTNLIEKERFAYYEKYVRKMFLFLKIFKPDLKAIEIEKKEAPDYYKCDLIMIYTHYRINQELESRGIRKLIRLFDYFVNASRGMITFIDELDSNINDIYLDKLIEYFMYYGKGQLCFTSHNLSPMKVLNDNKCSISFISGINTVHSWVKNGNESPENAYRNGFIEDSPFNVDATDFIGILGGTNEQTDSDVRGNE